MKQRLNNGIELLFVAGSSIDKRGRRVLVREGVIENVIWPGGPDEVDVALLGLTPQDEAHIERSFDRR